MKTTLALLAATAALGAVLALSSTGAGLASIFETTPGTERGQGATPPPDGMPVLLADNESDDDDEGDRQALRGADGDNCDGDERRSCAPGRDVARAGTVISPVDGFFRNGAVPRVVDGDNCDGDERRSCAPGRDVARAGTVISPVDGFFRNGAVPRVQVN